MINPESAAAQLMLASPDERQQALQQFPPARQEQIKKQLEWFDALPKDQQDLQIRRLERFAALPPFKKVIVRRRMEEFSQLPAERKVAVRRALMALQNLTEPQRTARLNSPGFKSRFSAQELQMIADLSEAWLPPI